MDYQGGAIFIFLICAAASCAVAGCLPGAIAQAKDRDFLSWWVYGALLFPIALPHSLSLRPSLIGRPSGKGDSNPRSFDHQYEYRTILAVGSARFDELLNMAASKDWVLMAVSMSWGVHYGYLRRDRA